MCGNVYFVQSGDFVKIGFASDVQKRVAELQTGSPHQLNVLAVLPDVDKSVEATCHRVFARNHFRGEWFRLDDDFLEAIAVLDCHGNQSNIKAIAELVAHPIERRALRKKVRRHYFVRLERERQIRKSA